MRNVLWGMFFVFALCVNYIFCVWYFLSHPESTLLYSSSTLFDSIILYLTLPYSLCAHFTDPYVLIFFFNYTFFFHDLLSWFLFHLYHCVLFSILFKIISYFFTSIFILQLFYFFFAFFLFFFYFFFHFYSKAAIEGEERGIELNELFIF